MNAFYNGMMATFGVAVAVAVMGVIASVVGSAALMAFIGAVTQQ